MLSRAFANGLLGLHRALRLLRHPVSGVRVLFGGGTLSDARRTLTKLLLRDDIVIENRDGTGSVCTRINRLGRVTVELRHPALLSPSLVTRHARDVDAEIDALRSGLERLTVLHGAATALPLLLTGIHLVLQLWYSPAAFLASLPVSMALGTAATLTIAMGFHRFLRGLAAAAGLRTRGGGRQHTRFPCAPAETGQSSQMN